MQKGDDFLKLDSKGITIIELLLGTVLFSFIALGVTFFISTGTKMCNHAEDTIRLQEEQQVLSNQLINISLEGNSTRVEMDADGNVCYYVLKTDRKSQETLNESIIYFRKSSKKVYYYEVDRATDSGEIADINTELSGGNIVIGQLMGELVTDVTIIPDTEKTITFKLEFSLNGKTVSSNHTVSLRNKYVEPLVPII